MTQRYVAPINIVSAQPDYSRYSEFDDRRKAVTKPSPSRRPDPPSRAPAVGSARRDFRAIGLVVLALALALVVGISMLG